MVASGQVNDDDPAYCKRDHDWGRLNDDAIPYMFFHQAFKVRSLGRPIPSGMKRLAVAVAFLFLLIVGWLIWPYYSLYRLILAFRSGDVTALESRVAWNSLRQGLRSDVNVMLASYANMRSEPGEALATNSAPAITPALIDQVLERFVTPRTVGSSQSGLRNKEQDPATISRVIKSIGGAHWSEVQHMFLTGPFSFRAQIQAPSDLDSRNPAMLILGWSGTWKLTRIILPNDALEAFVLASTQANQSAPEANDLLLRSSTVDPVALQKQKDDYIGNLQIYDFTARYYNSLKGRIPGVEFAIRNNGRRTLDMVQVTVYFKNAQGDTISKQDFTPVLLSRFSFAGNSKPLIPNSIWQPARGMFLAAKPVPPQWQEGSAEIRISNIEFEEGPIRR